MFYKKTIKNGEIKRFTRPQMRKAFGLRSGARIDNILNDFVVCKKAGIAYTGTRKIGPNTG
jgi:hypothetical protein